MINNNQNTHLPAVVESKSHTESSTENLSSTQEQEIPINDNQSIQQVSAKLDPTSLTPQKKKPKSETKEKKLKSEIEPKKSYNTSSNVSLILMSYFELLTKMSGDIRGLETNIVTEMTSEFNFDENKIFTAGNQNIVINHRTSKPTFFPAHKRSGCGMKIDRGALVMLPLNSGSQVN